MHRGDGGDYPGSWGLPGGHQEEGEALEECARREAEEETGLKFDGKLRKLHDDGQFCTYAARVDEPFEVTLCDESVGFTWAAECPDPAHPGIPSALRVLAAHTELDTAILIRDGVLPSPQWFSNIYLLDLRLSGTGMSFRSEIKKDGKILRAREDVYRDEAHYLSPESLPRWNGVSVVIDHPEKASLDGSEYLNRIAGAVMLPYVKGDEVWGICRIYAQDAINLLEAARTQGKPISTSPGVVFDAASENVTVLLENGDPLLFEGEPKLIDHIAICGLGVWDKGGEPAGISLNNEDLHMTEADKAKADAEEKARKDAEEKARKDAEEKEEKDRKDAARKDAEKVAFDKAVKDAAEAMYADKVRKDSEEAAADKARKDAEEKAEKEKEEKAEKDRKDAEERDRADAEACANTQAKMDSVYSALGERAPARMTGENHQRYRARLLTGIKKHSKVYDKADLYAVARVDAASFDAAEERICNDAMIFARTPMGPEGGSLHERIETGPGGHRISTFSGDAFVCWRPFMSRPEAVKVSSRAEINGLR